MNPRTLPLASILHIAKELILLVMNTPHLRRALATESPGIPLAIDLTSRNSAVLQALCNSLSARFAIGIAPEEISNDVSPAVDSLIDLIWKKLNSEWQDNIEVQS